MSQLRLTVPNRAKSYTWSNFINESLQHSKLVDELIVNFHNICFLETDDFVMLACLIESFYMNGSTITFQGGTQNFNHHLNNIRFKEYWQPNFNRECFTASKNRTTMCLWKISKEMIYSYSQYANKYFRDTFMNDTDLVPISSNLDEVFNNIFDHAESPVTGYILTQYFPKTNILSFSVCDFGIGIPTSINNHKIKNGENPILDGDALILALNAGYSIQSTPRNRGMGLHNIKELVEDSNGILTIVSNNGIIQIKNRKLKGTNASRSCFHGTLVRVEVDMDTFESMDHEDDIFGF